jgi:hypothetical protein
MPCLVELSIKIGIHTFLAALGQQVSRSGAVVCSGCWRLQYYKACTFGTFETRSSPRNEVVQVERETITTGRFKRSAVCFYPRRGSIPSYIAYSVE